MSCKNGNIINKIVIIDKIWGLVRSWRGRRVMNNWEWPKNGINYLCGIYFALFSPIDVSLKYLATL